MTNDAIDAGDDGPDDEHQEAHTHYLYDSNGHLYVDMTAVRKHGRIEVVPLGGGEVCVGVSEVRVTKDQPVLNVLTTQDGDTNLRDYFDVDSDDEEASETDGETALVEVPAEHAGVVTAVDTTLKNGHARPDDLYFFLGMSDEEIAALRE